MREGWQQTNGTCTQQLCVYTLSQSTLRFEPFVGLIKVRTFWELKSWLCTECTQYTIYNIQYTSVWRNLGEWKPCVYVGAGLERLFSLVTV